MEKTYRWGQPSLTARARATTNDLGEYRMFSLGPAEYYIVVEVGPSYGAASNRRESDPPLVSYYPGVGKISAATPVILGVDEERDAVDFTFTRIPVYTVSGTVVRPPGVQVDASNSIRSNGLQSFHVLPRGEGTDPIDTPFFQMPNLAPQTDPQGSEVPFEIHGIPAGEYDLFPVCCRGSGLSGRASVVVTAANVRDLRILMKPNRDIRGRIRVEGDGDATFRLDQVQVVLRPLRSTSLGDSFSGRPDPGTREFTINGVPEGRFEVAVEGIPYDAYVSALQAGPTDLLRNDGFDIGDSFDGVIDVTIAAKGSSIRGKVQRGILERGVGVAISLVPEQSRRGNASLYKRIDTNPTGEFLFRGIAPGNYKLFAWPASPPDSAEQNASFLKPYEDRGYSISVAGADIEGVVLPLIGK